LESLRERNLSRTAIFSEKERQSLPTCKLIDQCPSIPVARTNLQ